MAGWQDGDWPNEALCKFAESNLSNRAGLRERLTPHLVAIQRSR